MEGLNNQFDGGDGKSFIQKVKNWWNSQPTWLKMLIIFAGVVLLITVIIVVVVMIRKKKKEGFKLTSNKKQTMKKETFVKLNDITENSYVNSYIDATRGEIEGL